MLDAGGAGRYSVWLAECEYAVDLVDPSGRQAELAATKTAETAKRWRSLSTA